MVYVRAWTLIGLNDFYSEIKLLDTKLLQYEWWISSLTTSRWHGLIFCFLDNIYFFKKIIKHLLIYENGKQQMENEETILNECWIDVMKIGNMILLN